MLTFTPCLLAGEPMIISHLDPTSAELEFVFFASEIDREANNTPSRDPHLICPWL